MILAIETATDVCGAAVVHRGRVVAHRSISEKNINSEKLLSMVNEVLLDAALLLKDVDAIAEIAHKNGATLIEHGKRIGNGTAEGNHCGSDLGCSCIRVLPFTLKEFSRYRLPADRREAG